jgi:hypothetical protein
MDTPTGKKMNDLKILRETLQQFVDKNTAAIMVNAYRSRMERLIRSRMDIKPDRKYPNLKPYDQA